MSRPRRLWGLVIVLGVVLLAMLWLWRTVIEPGGLPAVHARARAEEPTPAPATPAAPESSPAPPLPPALAPPPADQAAPRVHDSVDPCTALREPAVPAAAEVVVANGITVASLPGEAPLPPTGTAFSPLATAHLISGVLEEAAAFTGTARRERLTAIVYPSSAEYWRQTQTPTWSGGAYDGSAIHLPVDPAGDLGVRMITLRHELMHAQLHAAVGCMPAWLDEGLAMYFDGAAPSRGWLRMIRDPDDQDLGAVFGRGFITLSGERAERAYAESVAMVAFMEGHGGDAAVRAALVALRELPPGARRSGLAVWDRLYPGAGHRVVLDALAVRVFGVGLGAELEARLKGVVCCYGFRAVREFACRTVPAVPDKAFWIDHTSTPDAICRTSW